jgi:hypothetical protein
MHRYRKSQVATKPSAMVVRKKRGGTRLVPHGTMPQCSRGGGGLRLLALLLGAVSSHTNMKVAALCVLVAIVYAELVIARLRT